MDIVNRLKSFMETHGIGSTQFADACGIPRPTLSQILSGRNKKISDEVISKIHAAYPRLSVLWLLFGEGQMESMANIAFSEAQNARQIPVKDNADSVLNPQIEASSNDVIEEDGGLFGASVSSEPLIFDDEKPLTEVQASGKTPEVTIPADGSKSIVNIMVFYSDNSYQSFVPR